MLERHEVPVRPEPGSPVERFPEPVPLTAALLGDLYVEVGCSAGHLELLTGQPAPRVRRELVRLGIEVRPGWASPVLRRIREKR